MARPSCTGADIIFVCIIQLQSFFYFTSLWFYSILIISLCISVYKQIDRWSVFNAQSTLPVISGWLYKQIKQNQCILGAGIAQWLERRTRDWKVAGSNPCWNGGRIFFSRVDFLCWLLFRYPFHPRVTTVARKKSRSFCQKVQVAGYS